MFNNLQLRKLIIQPVLRGLSLYTPEAEDLLVGTCAQESKGGTFLLQEFKPDEDPSQILKGGVAAIGIYQMQSKTHDDIWRGYLPAHPKQANDLMMTCAFSRKPTADMMVYNLYYATAMARVFYCRISDPIPTTIEDQAQYYKTYWNTSLGKATTDEYIMNYNMFNGISVKKGDKK